METTRKLTEIDPRDLPVVERVFGQQLKVAENVVLVLRTPDVPVETEDAASKADELPAWCNVLEGMSERDRDDFRSDLSVPVRLARSE